MKLVRDTTITVRFNKDEAAMIDAMCDSYGISQSEIVRCAVKYLNKHVDDFDGLYKHI